MPDARIDWPVRFAASSFGLRIAYNGFAQQTVTVPVTIDRNYWLSGDAQTDTSAGNGDLLRVLELALETYSLTALTATVTLNSNFRVSIVTPSNLTIYWSDVASTLDPMLFGFTAATFGPATSNVGANLPNGIWRPNRPISYDTRDRQPYVGGVLSAIGGLTEVSRVAVPYRTRDIDFRYLAPDRVLGEYSPVTEPTGAFEDLWDAVTANRPLRLYPDETSRASSGYREYRVRDLADPITREGAAQYWHTAALKLRRTS